MSWDQYNQTPASNDLSGYFQTNMLPSKVKNAGWDIMADLAQFMSLPTSGGTANSQTVTNTRQFGALFTGMTQWFLPGNANTGACTLAVDGLTAKNIFAYGAVLLGGELSTTVPALVKYDGTQWNLINPNDSKGSFTLTLTGMSAGTTGTVNWHISKGRLVTIEVLADILGTSNATTMTGTGVPTGIQPATTKIICYLATRDSGAVALGGQVQITASSGTWTFSNAGPITSGSFPRAWTNTGSKGLVTQCFSYTLD